MAQSDLLPETIGLSATTVVPGGSLTVSWSLVNQGAAAANSTSMTEVRITSSPTSYGNSSNNVGSVGTAAVTGSSSVFQSATVTVPTTPGTYYAWVIADNNSNVTNQSNVGNDEASSVAFTVAPPPPPSLGTVSPDSLPPDGNDHLMLLFGNNFQSGDTLVFTDPQGRTYNSVPSKLTVASDSLIEYALNDGSDAGTWSVQVYGPDGTTHSGSVNFTVATPVLTPSLDGVSSPVPSDGSNHTIQLLGNGFQSGDTLVFTDPQVHTYDSVPGKLNFVSINEIDYSLNDGSDTGTWTVQVFSPDGARHSGTSSFTVAVVPPPTLTSVSPGSMTSDALDHALQLLGSNFQSNDTLVFTDPQGRTYNSVFGKLFYVSASEIDYTFNNGGDSGTWTVQVVSPDGTQHSSSSSFTVAAAAVVNTAGSNISFSNTYGSGVSAAYKASIIAAEKDIESHWTAANPITISLDFLAAPLDNTIGAENNFPRVSVSYADLKSKLPSFDVPPANNPIPGSINSTADWSLPDAYARMLGLSTATPTYDAVVTLNSSIAWTYGQDVINALEHEITEGGMGRIGGLGDQNSSWSTMDLFRFSSAGVADYQDGRDGVLTYFSGDGGSTTSATAGLSFHNEYSGSIKKDSEDTADFNQRDVFGTVTAGETNTLSQTDLAVMKALGWQTVTPASTSSSGIDYRVQAGSALNGVNVATISGDGYKFVGEYIGQTANNGYLTASDAITLSGQGIAIVSIFERSPTSVAYFAGSTNGISNADFDAADAIAAAKAAGQPAGSAIYFTVDYDPSTQSDFNAIDKYFEEVRSDLASSPYKLGVYGPGDVLNVLARDSAVSPDFTFLDSYAWSANGFTGQNIQRIHNAVSAAPTSIGFNVDLDTAFGSNFGQWTAGSPGVSFAVSPQAVDVGGTLTFRISIQNPNYASTPDYLIYYNTGDRTAVAGTDYDGIPNQVAVHFTSSSPQFVDVTIQTLNNGDSKGTETFNFNVYDYQQALLEQVQGTITDLASTAKPDLSEYVAVSNTTVMSGGNVTVDAYAMNIGNSDVGASAAQIYLSTDPTITTSDTVLATVNSGALSSVGHSGYVDHQALSLTLPSNLAPGTYYIGGLADYNNQVSESNEANNTYNVVAITVAAPAKPDLSEYVAVSNTTVAAGGTTIVDAYAMNIGNGVSAASAAQIYLSTDPTITTSDTLLATVTSGTLAAVGQSGYVDHQTLPVTLPSNLAPGTYYIGGIADYNNQVSESNEANNTYNVVAITVTAPARPDLSEYVAVSNTSVAAGGTTTVDAYAMNIGGGVAAASAAQIYLSADPTITTSDTVLATVNSGTLATVGQPGYVDHQTLSVALPSNLAAGTYYIGGIADYNNQVSESNETNNTYNVVPITVTAPARPNLSEYVAVSSATLAAGASTTVDAYAMNIGSGVAASSAAQIYLSTDPTITTSDTVLAIVNSGTLATVGQPGYVDHQTMSVMLPSNLAAGTYYIGGIADYNNQVSESNETDNTYNVVPITVSAPARPNLSEYVAVSSATLAAGGSATVDAYAMNIGSGVAAGSAAQIYLSTDATITTSDTVLATVNSGTLASVSQPGYVDHQTLSVMLPSNLVAGTYYIGGIADYNNQVSESNETDNTYNVVSITVTAPAKPDLSEYVAVSSTTVAAGGITAVDAYAMNIGSGVAAGSVAQIYLSTDATITTSDTVLATLNSETLATVSQPGYVDHQTLSVVLPSDLAPGTYYIGGIADYNNAVSESNAANNTYNVTKITVTAPAPSPLILNDAAMWTAGAFTVVNTFNGNGGTVNYYAPVSFDGFVFTNPDRSDFALTSFDAGFATANGYFFDGTHVVDVPLGGAATVDTIHVQQQNGSLFSVQSVDLDTIFAAVGQSATFTGVKADNSVVTETFNLDSMQGMQTFHFDSSFTALKSLDFAPTMNEYFDNFTLTPGSASSGVAAAINDGATLEINTAFSGQVTFASSTGLLKLDDPSSFSGQVAGISGTSDVIDFDGFDHNTAAASYSASTGKLTVSDSTHSASITLVGNYSSSTFTASSDNHGGVLVVDPPISSNQNASGATGGLPAQAVPGNTIVASAGNETLTGARGNDTFVFKPGFGNLTVTNFQPATDTIEIDHTIFATVQALLAATHDDGQGNAMIVTDQAGSLTLKSVTVAELTQHQSDFHLI